jgi:hypothetical protein
MKTVGLSSGVEAQLVAVVMKETVVRIAVDEYYVKRKGHDEVQRWVRGRYEGRTFSRVAHQLTKSSKAMASTTTSTEEVCVGRDVILRRVGVFVLRTSSKDVRCQEEGKGEWRRCI